MVSLNEYITGKCLTMCPLDEIKLRQREKLVHILEMKPEEQKFNKNLMVKSFSRSAAGKSFQDPNNLRPPDILLQTVTYLLTDVVSRTDVPWITIYDFVMDRLRAVRQDMIIQNTSRAYNVSIFQAIVRFHSYASYRLCEEDVNNFDPYINNIHLRECLKRLLCMFDDYDLLDSRNDINNDYLIRTRPIFEALYVVLNLGNTTALVRGLSLSKKWRTKLVDDAINMSLCYHNNNLMKAARLMKELPALHMAVAILHLPDLRRKMLKVMSVAYNSRNLEFPIGILSKWLLYDDESKLVEDCECFGLAVKENSSVCFLKNDFKDAVAAQKPSRCSFVDEKLKEKTISELILYD